MMRVFLLMLFFPCTFVLAKGPAEESAVAKCKASSLFRIVAEQPHSIQHVDKERVYLRSENIYHTNAGYVLYDGRSVIPLARLSGSSEGAYIPCRSREDFQLKCSNPNCGYVWWFSDTWEIYCPVCRSIGD